MIALNLARNSYFAQQSKKYIDEKRCRFLNKILPCLKRSIDQSPEMYYRFEKKYGKSAE